MTEFSPSVEQAIADMTTEDFNALVARTRPPEDSRDKRVQAALAVRQMRTGQLTKEQVRSDFHNEPQYAKQAAVDAIREACGYKVTTEDGD